MSDGSDGLIEKLYSWLDTSGRALELRVTRRFREARAMVSPSFAFIDTVTGLGRETDVVAEFEWQAKLSQTTDLSCSLTAVVECKSSKKHPWVAFREGSPRASSSNLDDWFAWAFAPFTPVTDRLPSLWIWEEPFTERQPATHVVAARIGETGSASASNEQNLANDAIRQVLSACTAMRRSYIDRQGREQRGLFLLPVVVTSARLFNCTLSNDGQPVLAETDAFDVWAAGHDGRRTRVYVMNENRLGGFASSLQERSLQAGSS